MHEKEVAIGPNTANLDTTSETGYKGIFSEKLHVKVLDWTASDVSHIWKQQICEKSQDFPSILDDRTGVKQRIISFHSPATCLPLKASSADFQALQNTHNVHSEFLSTLAAFGRFPDPANGYAIPPTVCRDYAPGSDPSSFEIWYRLQYPERNHRSTRNPWSIRHTGIYHQYNARTDFSLVILIHPCRDTVLETVLFDSNSSLRGSARDRLAEDTLSIHQILCDAYLANWSPCIRDQSKTQEETNDNVQTSDLKTGSLESDFRITQQLRFLMNATTTNGLFCRDNVAALDKLREIFESSPSKLQWLDINRAKVTASCDGLVLLQKRIQNDLDLLEHAATQRDSRINHHNQTIAADLNSTLLNLTYNTVDDSATIKIITIFSLIFLPGSFIASLFGMNFFVFESSSHSSTGGGENDSATTWNGLTIGQNFWVFVATWLPVTALVLLVYVGVVCRRMKIVKQRREGMRQQKEREVQDEIV